jgi:hypothetical protein
MAKNKAAAELGKRGGSVTSEAKAKAARENAKRPRKKPIPALDCETLLRSALLEIETEMRRCEVMGEQYEGTQINGYALNVLIRNHLGLSLS